jgi:hypothetical protein
MTTKTAKKPAKVSKAEEKEARLQARRKLIGMPETKALFERAHKEPTIRGMEATEYGMTVTFHGLHPKHVSRLIDAIDQLRSESTRKACTDDEES